MPDTKISAAADAGTLLANDMLPLARTGSTTAYHATMAEIGAYAGTTLPVASTTVLGGVKVDGTTITISSAVISAAPDLSRAPINAPVFTGDARAVTPPAGDNDTSIATSAFVQAAVAPAVANVGRNLLHNSMFNVQQRGNPGWTASGYTADRWAIGLSPPDAATFQMSAMSDAQRTAIGDEAAKWCMTNIFVGNGAAGASHFLEHRIEDVRRLAGKTVTASFWAVASATQKLGVSTLQVFGSGGSPSAVVVINGTAVQLSNIWTRYTVTFAVPSVSGKTLGTNGDDWTGLRLWYSSGSTNAAQSGNVGVQSGTIQLWGVQLEIGSVATPLEKISYEDDLRHCQRFYQGGSVASYGYGVAAGNIGYFLSWPVTMRAVPTVAFSGTTYSNASGIVASSLIPQGAVITANTTALGYANFYSNFTASADL